jgi:hypothetical protein
MFAHFSFATLWGAEPEKLKFTSFQSIPQARPAVRSVSCYYGERMHTALHRPANLPEANQQVDGQGRAPVS